MQELKASREVVAVRKKRATEATVVNSTSADARLLMIGSPLGGFRSCAKRCCSSPSGVGSVSYTVDES